MSIIKYINNQIISLDMAEPWQLGFQDPATPVMEGIISFHHDLFFFLIIITIFFSWMLFKTVLNFEKKKNNVPMTTVHGSFIEIIWTTIPALILLILAVPSFALLYFNDCRDSSL